MIDENRYTWLPSMNEISGLGGDYEEACRTMLRAGLTWLDAHPGADPIFEAYSNVYGILDEKNGDAKDFVMHVIDACEDGPTGAMVQAVIEHCLFVRKHGWEKYVHDMSQKPESEA